MTTEHHEKSLPLSPDHGSPHPADFTGRPFVIALTGGIGSGKSRVALAFAQLGVPIVDADIIARELVLPGMPALAAIVEHFGADILLSDGQLNRSALKQRIFTQSEERAWLNRLLHPLIQQETQRQLDQITAPYALWVVPLLVENRLQQHADRILVVKVNKEIQLARILLRDGIDGQQAKSILATQAEPEERLSYADDIIDNNGTADHIAPQVIALHQRYLAMATATRLAGLKNDE